MATLQKWFRKLLLRVNDIEQKQNDIYALLTRMSDATPNLPEQLSSGTAKSILASRLPLASSDAVIAFGTEVDNNETLLEELKRMAVYSCCTDLRRSIKDYFLRLAPPAVWRVFNVQGRNGKQAIPTNIVFALEDAIVSKSTLKRQMSSKQTCSSVIGDVFKHIGAPAKRTSEPVPLSHPDAILNDGSEFEAAEADDEG